MSLHHPRYPDIPVWLRITGVAGKDMTTLNLSNTGKTPSNSKIDWSLYTDDIVRMLEEGMSSYQIAKVLDLGPDLVSSKCRHLIETGRAMV